ncbi:MAG: DinB family protein [Bacteroidota bacterium]|nr:DinB family protein [Bacteroidota bacterium]
MIHISLTERLKSQHTTLPSIIAKLDERQLRYRPEAGKWNIHDNIAHLAKYQPIFLERVNTIITTDDPSFGRYKAEDDGSFNIWREYSTGKLVEKLLAGRGQIVEKVTALSEPELNRTGNHPRFGKLTVVEWTEFFLLHEAHHIFTIFQLAHTGLTPALSKGERV